MMYSSVCMSEFTKMSQHTLHGLASILLCRATLSPSYVANVFIFVCILFLKFSKKVKKYIESMRLTSVQYTYTRATTLLKYMIVMYSDYTWIQTDSIVSVDMCSR